MRVSLNLIKKYVDIPKDITPEKIAYDLTLKTVEVEKMEETAKKYHDIVVGKILEVKAHPNADMLRICQVDIGEEKVQIVCGGSNLYENELVVVSKPGSEVYWHGTGDLVKISKTKMRGEESYGMICGATEVYLENLFPPKDEREIVDLKGYDCKPGDNIANVIDDNDIVLEIDNKSLSNRPDLWGYYGIARELSVIYNCDLKPLEKYEIDKTLPKYDVEILDSNKCLRYDAVKIENVYVKESPLWLKRALINCGMRPINALVDITNYVMITTGQPEHAFDSTHVKDEKIVARAAKEGEKLLLLDNNEIELTKDDLVICDSESPLALAGIKGGKKDSILDTTTSVLLEVANFNASTIRKTDKRFMEKTDAAMRYEKSLDTQRVDEGLGLALSLFKELYPECKFTKYADIYPVETKNAYIEVPQSFLDDRLGKKLDSNLIINTLTKLGFEVKYEDNIYKIVVPTYRSTGDIALKDDVMGELVRILGFNSFEAKPLDIKHTSAIIQNKVLLERRIREFLAKRCGFNEVITYPWVDEKYIDAAGINKENAIKLATPPAPELAYLRSSLIPNILDVITKNLRYFEDFKVFEVNQVFEKGQYHESSVDETLPVHKKMICGAIVGKDPKKIFYDLKGVLENISSYNHMEDIKLVPGNKASWADINAYLDITLNDEKIGEFGLLNVSTMNKCKIKRTNVALFEINFDKLVPFTSRTNVYHRLPEFPLVEKDLSIIVDKEVTWQMINDLVSPKVKELIFVDEYEGSQIPSGKKSISLRFKVGKDDGTMSGEEIQEKMNQLSNLLSKKLGAILREE